MSVGLLAPRDSTDGDGVDSNIVDESQSSIDTDLFASVFVGESSTLRFFLVLLVEESGTNTGDPWCLAPDFRFFLPGPRLRGVGSRKHCIPEVTQFLHGVSSLHPIFRSEKQADC